MLIVTTTDIQLKVKGQIKIKIMYPLWSCDLHLSYLSEQSFIIIFRINNSQLYWSLETYPGIKLSASPIAQDHKNLCWGPGYFQTIAQLATEILNSSCAKPVAEPHEFCWATKIVFLGNPAGNCNKNAKLYHIMLYLVHFAINGIRTHSFSGDILFVKTLYFICLNNQ